MRWNIDARPEARSIRLIMTFNMFVEALIYYNEAIVFQREYEINFRGSL